MSDKITINAYRCNANGGTQVTIEQTDEDGRGWGRRLAGPKHYNMGTTTLVSAELDADDAREIRAKIDAVFPEQPSRADLTAEIEQLRAKLAEAQDDSRRLNALESFGVDNWDGYSDAMASLDDED